jgi:hypothetical protein
MNRCRPDYLPSERYGSDKRFYHFLHLALTDSLGKTNPGTYVIERRGV